MSARLVLGYVRVSAVEQEQGFGPEEQTRRIHAYCEERDLGTPEIIYESKSGESIIKRAELHMLLARAEAAVEDDCEVHIAFPGLDRLARNLIDQESVVTRSQRCGIRIHSTLSSENDTLDPAYADDPMRVAIRQFFGIINQLDRAIIQRRLDGGLARKAAAGGFTGGRLPFGYRSQDQEIEIDEEQAAVVRRIFAAAEHGLDQGTIASIVGSQWPTLCGHWHKRQVGRILARKDLYCGGRYRPRMGAQEIDRPDLIIVTGDEDFEPTGFDWDRLPDPVRLEGLATLLQITPEALREIVTLNGFLVHNRRSGVYFPKKSALAVRDYVSAGE